MENVENDYLTCSAVGTINSQIKISEQRDGKKIIRFTLCVPSSKEKISIKFFNVEPEKVEEITKTFGYGDRIRVTGDVQCDAYTSREKLIRGINIVPTKIELLKKSTLENRSDIQIINHLTSEQ